ncbi:MAG: pyridoxamine 5'-phosphate oxidase family protein [Bacillota bacterium]
MFKKMRRDEKKLSEKKVYDILKTTEYGILSTVGENGYPYGVPVNYIILNKKIYFHCAKDGHKLDNIRFNNRVSFSVVNKYELVPNNFTSKYESVIVFGKAKFVDKEIKREALRGFIDKFSPSFKEKGYKYVDNALDKTEIVEITIEDIKGKKNG